MTFAWDFDGLGSSVDENPAFAFPLNEPATYTICLAASDSSGCADTTCMDLVILDHLEVHVPNAFSPNGDGINDGFAPTLNIPVALDYGFMVFDRWGEEIFSSDQPGKAWDGTCGGDLVQTEVYVWKVTYREQLSTDLIEVIGHVTLLK